MIFTPGGPGLSQCPTYTLKQSSKGRTSVIKVKKSGGLAGSENGEGTQNGFNRGANGLRDVRENNRQAQILWTRSRGGPTYTMKEKGQAETRLKCGNKAPRADLTPPLMNSMKVRDRRW